MDHEIWQRIRIFPFHGVWNNQLQAPACPNYKPINIQRVNGALYQRNRLNQRKMA